MATGQIEASAAQGHTERAWDDLQTLPDDELLDRFLNHSGADAQEAFRVVVERHGPMVLGVCRHVLGHQQDAEDAFQAVFLVLARKAVSIHDRRVLGRWLYEVAFRIALRAKSGAIRKRANERQGAEMLVTAPEIDPGWSELRPVLHEEINRLPETYRTPVVLCYLEGKTNDEAARLLQWPVGTVKGRLSRARELLRARLTRRGLALSAAFLLTALSRSAVFAESVPSRLIEDTVASALKIKAEPPSSLGTDPLALDPPQKTSLKSILGQPLQLKLPRAAQVILLVALLAVLGGWLTGALGALPGVFLPRQPLAPSGSATQSSSASASCH